MNAVRLHVRKIEFDANINAYKFVPADDSDGQHKISKQIDVDEVLSVKGKLNLWTTKLSHLAF